MTQNTKKRFDRQNRYNSDTYDRYSATFPKGKKAKYIELAKMRGMSLNALINNLLDNKLNKQNSTQNSK